MAGVTLGFLKFVLGFDTIAFKKGMTQAERDLVVLQKKVASFGKGMKDIGKTMSLAITAPLIALAGSGIKEAQETFVAMGRVNNALAQTGAVAKQTAPELQKMANALELKSLYEADQILGDVTATMLTFGKILPQNFAAAQQAAVDFASKTGADLQASAIAIGKALQDPVKGMKALKAVGIALNADQIKQLKTWIDTGQAAKAQGFILDQLNSKIAGAAAAAQETDPFNKLSDAYKNLAESLGTVLLPFLTKASNFVVDLVGKFQALSPETQKWIGIIAGVAAVVGPVLIVLGSLVTAIAAIAPVVATVAGVLGTLGAIIAATSAAFASLVVAMAPILLPLAALAAAIGLVYLTWKHWDVIGPIVQSVYAAVKLWLYDKLGAVWNWLKGKLAEVTSWFQKMADLVVLHSIVPDMVAGIGSEMNRLDAIMNAPVAKATKKVTDQFRKLATDTAGIMATLFPEQAAASARLADLETLRKALKAGLLTANSYDEALNRLFAGGAPDVAQGPIDQNATTIQDWVDKTDQSLGDLSKLNRSKTEEMALAWADFAERAVGSMRDMVSAFKGGDILGGIQSVLGTVLDLLQALNRMGVLGKAPAGGGFGGGLAAGGPIVPGKTYMVGEQGPEFVTTKRRGYVHPSGSEAQPQRVVVVPSAYFDVVVDHRAANVAAPMAGKAAIIGVTGAQAQQTRRARRNLLAA